MKISSFLLSFLTFVATALPCAAFAADVAFFPVETNNVPPADATAIGELLAQSYASVSGQAVLAPSRIAADARNYPERAAAIGVAEYVRTDAVLAGQRIVIHSVRYKADGTSLYQTKMVAERADDLINVSDRMARALYHRVNDEEVRTRDNVTLTEARAQNRLWTEKVVGFKAGLHAPFARGADYTNSVGAQFDMRLEADRFFLEFGAGLILPASDGDDDDDWCDYDDESCEVGDDNDGYLAALTAEIGASYYLTDGNVAPYVSAGLIPRLTFSEDLAQLLPYAGVGVMLPRDSSMRFYLDARVAQSVTQQRLDNDKKVYPTELLFHAGLGW